MFSKISQLGKNISDELESVVNKPSSRSVSDSSIFVNGSGNTNSSRSKPAGFETLVKNAALRNQSKSDLTALNVSSLNTDPESLDQPGSNEITTPADQYNDSSSTMELQSQHSIDHEDDIPLGKNISSKLRKFKKYEEKYPGKLFVFCDFFLFWLLEC